jgi:peroxiredoxin
MFGNPRIKWYAAAAVALLLVGLAGLAVGKRKEGDYLSALYERRDFTLLDDKGDFFRLNSLPERTLALLVFTPDGIPPETVKPFYEFGRHVDDLRLRGIEPFLVSRTNREIVKNFKRASRFSARLLLDTGGTVGRNAGVWDYQPVATWSYALVDRTFHVLWLANSDEPMAYDELMKELRKAK